jgi:type IV pilus assembly protein PilC
MKRYKYKAKNDKGELVEGEVEASTETHAAKLIRHEGLVVISIFPKSNFSLNVLKKFSDRITLGDVTTFTRQFATMINSGLPLTEALLILRSQAKGSMQKIVAQILSDVEEGEALSATMAKHPQAFSKTYIALIKSGEVGGVMDEVLVRLADNMERQEEFRGKVKGALIYPIVILFGMVGVALVMTIFVIPRLTTLYEQFDANLPISTKILIGFSKMTTTFWPLMLLGFGAAIYGFKLYHATPEGRKMIDDLIFKLPLIGDLQRQIVLADLTRTLSLMVGSGVSIIESITISSEVVGNTVVSDALKDVNKMVEKGFPIAFSFSRHPEAFPFILSQMVAVGEETGKIDEVLAKISHVFEVESDQKLKALTAAVEPAILIVLGVGVAFLVISIIMPIYNLTTQI